LIAECGRLMLETIAVLPERTVLPEREVEMKQ
jgi:hypothetical protein